MHNNIVIENNNLHLISTCGKSIYINSLLYKIQIRTLALCLLRQGGAHGAAASAIFASAAMELRSTCHGPSANVILLPQRHRSSCIESPIGSRKLPVRWTIASLASNRRRIYVPELERTIGSSPQDVEPPGKTSRRMRGLERASHIPHVIGRLDCLKIAIRANDTMAPNGSWNDARGYVKLSDAPQKRRSLSNLPIIVIPIIPSSGAPPIFLQMTTKRMTCRRLTTFEHSRGTPEATDVPWANVAARAFPGRGIAQDETAYP